MWKFSDLKTRNTLGTRSLFKKFGLTAACLFVCAQVAIIGLPYGSPVQPFSTSISLPVSARLDESLGEPPLRAASFAGRVLLGSAVVRDSVALISRGQDPDSSVKYPRITLVRSPAANVPNTQKQARSYRAYPSAANVSALNQGYGSGTITASEIASQLQNPNGSLAVVDLDPPTSSSPSTFLANASEDLVLGFNDGTFTQRHYSVLAIIRNFDQTARALTEPANGAVRPNLNAEILRFNCKTAVPYGPCLNGPKHSTRDNTSAVRAIYPIDVDNNGLMDLLIAAESTRDINDPTDTSAGARVFLCRNFGDRFGCKGTGWRGNALVSPGLNPFVTCFETSTGATDCDGLPRLGTTMTAIASSTGNGEYSFLTFAGQYVFVTKTTVNSTAVVSTQYDYDGFVSAAQFAQVNPHEDSLIDMLVHIRPVAAPVNENSEDWLWRGPIPTTNINMIERIHVCRGVAGGTCVNQDPIPVSDGLVTATGGVGFRYGKSAPLIGVFDLAAPTGSILDGKPEILIAATLAGDEASHIQDESNFREIRLLTVGGNPIDQVNLPSSSTLAAAGTPTQALSEFDEPITIPGVKEVLSGMLGNFVNAHHSKLMFQGLAPAPDIAIALKDSGDVIFINNRFSAPSDMIVQEGAFAELASDTLESLIEPGAALSR